MAAMADGMLDAALLLVYEGRYRPENMRVDAWVEMQQKKIDTALALLESSPPAGRPTPTTATSRLPRHLVIWIFAMADGGVKDIQTWSHGLTRLLTPFRHLA